MRRLFLALLLLAAACQPVVRPADRLPQGAALPALSPPDSAGVMVLPAEGAPDAAAQALAAAMAKALRDADVPASTTAHNQRSYRLFAKAAQSPAGPGESAITIAWRLENAAGRTVGTHQDRAEAATATWQGGDGALARQLAQAAAPAIATLIEGDAPLPAADANPVVVVGAVTGAPGDGGPRLATAIANALQRENLAVAGAAHGPASFVLSGRVEMSPAAAGKQHVKVAWRLARPDGSEVGVVRQENDVPAGSLDHAWGDVAYAVASAAAPGIATLIAHLTGEPTGS